MTKCFSLHKIAKGSATVKRHKAAHWPIEEFQFQQEEVNHQASYVAMDGTESYSWPVTLLFLFLNHKGTSAYNWDSSSIDAIWTSLEVSVMKMGAYPTIHLQKRSLQQPVTFLSQHHYSSLLRLQNSKGVFVSFEFIL